MTVEDARAYLMESILEAEDVIVRPSDIHIPAASTCAWWCLST